MKRWRLLEKKRNIAKLQNKAYSMNESFILRRDIREIVKQELLSATNSLRVGIYQD